MTAPQPATVQLAFDEREIAQFARMRAGVAEFRTLQSEIEAGKRALPDLAGAEQAARDTIEACLPSRLIAFPKEIEFAFIALRRAELVQAALKEAIRRLESRLAVLASDLERSFRELQQSLRWKVRDAFPAPGRNNEKLNTNSGIISPVCSAAIHRVVTIEGGNIADRADALLALATEHGLQLLGVES